MAKTPITIGYAGVIHPGANGTPKIIGPEAINVPEINDSATPSSKDRPIPIAIGIPAKAVAPEIIIPCKNSAVLNLICRKGTLSLKGPHLIPFTSTLSVFILINLPYHPLNLLK